MQIQQYIQSTVNELIPNKVNKIPICHDMLATFNDRGKYFLEDHPSITEILAKYVHLTSYYGEIVSPKKLHTHLQTFYIFLPFRFWMNSNEFSKIIWILHFFYNFEIFTNKLVLTDHCIQFSNE